VRLAKYLAQAGIASRRQAEELIRTGRIKLNGQVATDVATKVDIQKDRIEFDGVSVSPEQPVYILLNKPPGFLSTVADSRQRATVVQLVPNRAERIFPVGRLDQDTAGLLLMTNDGDFTNLMIHPRYKIDKRYEAVIEGNIGSEELGMLRNGICLDDGLTAPAQVRIIRSGTKESVIELVIHEGRKRQVKRMLAAVGHPVKKLTRTGLGFLNLDGVEEGRYRFLRQEEVDELVDLARHRRAKFPK